MPDVTVRIKDENVPELIAAMRYEFGQYTNPDTGEIRDYTQAELLKLVKQVWIGWLRSRVKEYRTYERNRIFDVEEPAIGE